MVSAFLAVTLARLILVQAYPALLFKIVLTGTAGGTVDIFARGITTELQRYLSQSVLAHHKSDADANICSEFIANAPYFSSRAGTYE